MNDRPPQHGSDDRPARGPSEPAPPLGDPAPVQRLGDYRLIREIGRGGMGVVYEAEQESLHRRVALKLLPLQSLSQPGSVRRFEREARTAAALHHTNIVPVIGVGHQDKFHYLVMQYIDGIGLDKLITQLRVGSLASDQSRFSRSDTRIFARTFAPMVEQAESAAAPESSPPTSDLPPEQTTQAGSVLLQLLSKQATEGVPQPDGTANAGAELMFTTTGLAAEPVSSQASSGVSTDNNDPPIHPPEGRVYWAAVAQLGIQVADALDYAHTQGTLHRDVNPANLLVDRAGTVWITDFGLARSVDGSDVSQAGQLAGTLRYMAPEQFRGHVDQRSDMYGLGLTLYELLTLRPAFQTSGRPELIRSITESRPEPPRQLHPAIPRDLETIVLKCIAAQPQHRYPSVRALSADLQRFLDDRPIKARRVTLPERIWRRCRRSPVVAGLTAVSLVLLALVVTTIAVGYVREVELRRRTESTLEISLEALDRVYRQLAPDRVTVARADLETRPELPGRATLTKETARLLEDLLPAYDRLAQQDTRNLALRAEAARANRRVGDIRQRLGQHVQAVDAYRQAIARYESLAEETRNRRGFAATLAGLHNELGNVLLQAGDRDRAEAAYHEALRTLDFVDKGPASDAARFELARTCYYLGRRVPPQDSASPALGSRGGPLLNGPPHGFPNGPPIGFRDDPVDGPNGFAGDAPDEGDAPDAADEAHTHRSDDHGLSPDSRKWLEQAIGVLDELRQSSPETPAYQYLLALCHRDIAQGLESEARDRAIAILETLVTDYPQVADYRHQLSETYASFEPRGLRGNGLTIAEERLRQAWTHSQVLVTQYPEVPDHASLHAHVAHKLAEILRRRAVRTSILDRQLCLVDADHFSETASRVQAGLVEEFPEHLPYLAWLARLRDSRSLILMELGRFAAAESELEQSRQTLEAAIKLHPDAESLTTALERNELARQHAARRRPSRP